MKNFILYSVFFFWAVSAYCQSHGSVSGKVLDETKQPVPFVYIVIDSLSMNSISNEDGSFILEKVPLGEHELTVRYMGYKPYSVKVAVENNLPLHLEISLTPSSRQLDEVVITSEQGKKLLEQSSKAITVLDTKELKLKSTDLGQLLAQTQGVSVRRSGGLGSGASVSLNGLSGKQIRYFVDGIPLDYLGYTFGLSTIPVSLIDRIEIYKGVVPVQLAGDALGGAINVVSPIVSEDWSGALSYQTGSFGTHRTTGGVGYSHKKSGLYVLTNAFLDHVKNSYKVTVDIPNEKGKTTATEVPRFHDAYRAAGGRLTLGIRDRKWAKLLSAETFYTHYYKEVQHNILMTGIPYGEVASVRESYGSVVRYNQDLTAKLHLNVAIGYSHLKREFSDTSHYAFDWYGNVLLTKNKPGEISQGVSGPVGATHQFTYTDHTFARFNAGWILNDRHKLTASSAPDYSLRNGDDILLDSYDPLSAENHLTSWVNGLSYNYSSADGKIENTLFGKQYFLALQSKEPTLSDTTLETKERYALWGIGNGFKYQFAEQFLLKLSYEYATRLPRSNEIFGDGQFTIRNLGLKPERSHNVNFELSLSSKSSYMGNWRVRSNTFLRKVNDLIFFVPGEERENTYQNVLKANSIGTELDLSWSSPGQRWIASANTTLQDYYNNSKEGIFRDFYRDRIPNQPYFFSNANLSHTFDQIVQSTDKLTVFWSSNYVHPFYRSWESAGLKSYKAQIPAQWNHNAGVTYKSIINKVFLAMTIEVQNLTNEKNFDYYGVQKPGRAFYVKISTQL